jgi:hypothetical protein
MSPAECSELGVACKCYGPEQEKKIFQAITDLTKCNVDLKEKNDYISNRLVSPSGGEPIAFWQEPTFVFGSIVATVGITAGVMTWVLSRSK